jgi:hypothetical protein
VGSGNFGNSVTSGDIDGDGLSDVIIGAPGETSNATGGGHVYVFLGKTTGFPGTPIVLSGNPVSAPGQAFGTAVASAGDFNGDGRDDLVIGAPGATYLCGSPSANQRCGLVYFFVGDASGTPMQAPAFTLQGDSAGDGANSNFAATVSSAGDIDGDGYADCLVGASGYTGGGRTHVFYKCLQSGGGAAQILPSPTGTGAFGYALAAVGPVSGGATNNFAISPSNTQLVYVYTLTAAPGTFTHVDVAAPSGIFGFGTALAFLGIDAPRFETKLTQ